MGNHYPIFINILDEDKDVKGQLGLVINQSIVTAYSSRLMSNTFNLFSKLGSRAVWAGGPVIHASDKMQRLEILKTVIKALEIVSKNNDIVLIDGYTPHQDFLIDEGYKNAFKISDYQVQSFFTFATETSKSLEQIWNGVHESAKRDVKRAQKRNITVKELIDFSELDDYFMLSNKWAKTKGIDTQIPPRYKKEYWKCIESGIEKIFLAYEDDELVTSHRLGCFNSIAFSHRITNSYSKPTSLGGPLLTWHAIEWAKKYGMWVFDFSGGESPPTNMTNEKKYVEQWNTLLTYKRKWGGQEFPYYHLLKIRKKINYKLFRILSKTDWAFRNYKKKQYKRPATVKN